MKKKLIIIGALLILILIVTAFLFFRYFFTYEQRNILQRRIETVTGQNLTVTIFGYDGRVIKRWTNIEKITSGAEGKNYTFFYTKNNKYVQIPNSVWYIAEE